MVAMRGFAIRPNWRRIINDALQESMGITLHDVADGFASAMFRSGAIYADIERMRKRAEKP